MRDGFTSKPIREETLAVSTRRFHARHACRLADTLNKPARSLQQRKRPARCGSDGLGLPLSRQGAA